MFEFEDVSMNSDNTSEYYRYTILQLGRWNISKDSTIKLAIL